MASLGAPRKRGRGDSGGGTSHPNTPPRPPLDELRMAAGRGYAYAVLAEDRQPPKRTKVQGSYERALSAEEMCVAWQKAWEELLSQMNTCRVAMEAYETMITIGKENAAACEEGWEKKVDGLQEQVRELRGVVEEKEKVRAQLKEKTVSRGCEIAAMREAVSKLKKEMEADKNKKVPKADKVVQTEAVAERVAATQIPVRNYARDRKSVV